MRRKLAFFAVLLLVLFVAVGLLIYAEHFGNVKMYDQMVELVKNAIFVILGAGATEVSTSHNQTAGQVKIGPKLVFFGILFLVLFVAVGLLIYADYVVDVKMYDQIVEVVKAAFFVILGAGATEVAR